MNHRVSIVVSNTSTALKVDSDLPKFARISESQMQLPLKISLKECVHCPFFFFFIVEPCAEFTCYSPLMLCHSFSFSGQRSTVVPGHARTKHSSPWIRSFRPFLLALFFSFSFLANWPFTVERYGCLCVASFKLLMKKNLTPQRHVFSPSSQYPHGERMFEDGKSTNRIIHDVFPYTFRRLALRFRSFSIKPVEAACGQRVYWESARSSSIGFSFSAFLFFVSPLKQKWHKSVIRNDTKSVTSKPEHVRLFPLFDCRWSPTACQSMTFLQHVQDSSALSMLTKPACCSQYQQ